ncbi:NAD(P)-binding domain-containing protein [Falsochrobactrum sp. TDYN1]|uniref:Pyrroline-5-carboxylate reductase n=1 Tax=Falsochrobactrum tianjinense TaxID=2706015 RepID=A0A949UT08_9HYPH|nr:pyrroline-5-carboxylate reductase dimerization domain-containing protein [Falsochrobactrum sp. TDYN1]MBV2143459.1 NAD(P)-binding domain-containing protein [Falsochrobactrum sp. TDYN1]
MTNIGRVGLIGGSGWLGTAIAKALLNSDTISIGQLTCSFRSGKPQNALPCVWTPDNKQLVENSDIVILSVRPADWASVDIDATGKLIISVMAGVGVEEIKQRTGSSRVARALPNAAAEIGFSYTPFFIDSSDPGDRNIVGTLFASCGAVDTVSAEEYIDYFTAMSGSGAAFPALLAEAMMNHAVAQGLPPEIARRAAQQVLIGAGRLQEYNGVSPDETVKLFVDYQGTTTAGILAMREDGFEKAVNSGLDAAVRAAQLLSGKGSS